MNNGSFEGISVYIKKDLDIRLFIQYGPLLSRNLNTFLPPPPSKKENEMKSVFNLKESLLQFY